MFIIYRNKIERIFSIILILLLFVIFLVINESNFSNAGSATALRQKNSSALSTNSFLSETVNNNNINSTSFSRDLSETNLKHYNDRQASFFQNEHQLKSNNIYNGSLDLSNPELFAKHSANLAECKGRVRLNGTRGFITDGAGLYLTNLQCSWLIDSGLGNATIRLRFHHFNTECNYDYLYIFDGDSIYSPLVAALSGDIDDFTTNFSEKSLVNKISPSRSKSSATKDDTNSEAASIFDQHPFEITTESGKAFIYFHSDTAQSMDGFYIRYSINSCPLDCSYNGLCVHIDEKTSYCNCSPNFYGDGCQFVACPNNCTSPQQGVCDLKRLKCECSKGFSGPDCSKSSQEERWINIQDPYYESTIEPRAFHQALVIDSIMWVVGGKTKSLCNSNLALNLRKKTTTVMKFDLSNQVWLEERLIGMTNQDHLAELSSHSAVVYKNKIYVYGGLSYNNSISNTLSIIDTQSMHIKTQIGKKVVHVANQEPKPPLPVVGHSANAISRFMYIFLGYNPLYGYLDVVQKYDFEEDKWSLVESKGTSVDGLIGHSSTYDSSTNVVYLFGGHNAERSHYLYSFDVSTEKWTFLQPAPNSRYFHGAVIVNRQLLIIGGNSYNSTGHSDQCFRKKSLVFDLSCARTKFSNISDEQYCEHECWQTYEMLEPGISKRHGHSVVLYGSDLIMFGGFNGFLLDQIYKYRINSCDKFKNEIECSKLKLGTKCFWNDDEQTCQDETTRLVNSSSFNQLTTACIQSDHKAIQQVCDGRRTCHDCLNTNLGCVWCGLVGQCQFGKCKSTSRLTFSNQDSCYKDSNGSAMTLSSTESTQLTREDILNELECKKYDTCYRCHTKPYCSWQNEQGCNHNPPSNMMSPTTSVMPAGEDLHDINKPSIEHKDERASDSAITLHHYNPFNSFNRSFLAELTNSLLSPSPLREFCDTPCFRRRSCVDCTSTKCIWCSTSEECIDSSAYFAYHGMGQCMHYIAHTLKCNAASCSDVDSCDACLLNPRCGWLNDKSDTGKGKCIDGDNSGPSSKYNLTVDTQNDKEVLSNWFYTACPSCQCNGHSYCMGNASVCIQPCLDNTEGLHCERCTSGYYGDPVNGGTCRPCRCNGHAQSCNRENGKCYCSTKGIIGHNCNRCDDQNHYIGDIGVNHTGTCYYNLTTDYQYTFNMSKPEDHYYSEINFINVPSRRDADVDFTILCSRLALINITSGFSYKNKRPIQAGLPCGSTIRLRFPFEKHLIGDTNYSFFVHVYKIQTPFILQISFSQHRPLLLPQFFLTFSSCFLFFFALTGLLWKLKHEYNLYVRRQQQFIELEQMANRPFSTILLELPQQLWNKTAAGQKNDDSSSSVPRDFNKLGKSGSYQSKSNGKVSCSQSEKKLDQTDACLTSTPKEPTPISFEPCFGGNIGVVSMFVQLPGKTNLAIGSALIGLTDNASKDENVSL